MNLAFMFGDTDFEELEKDIKTCDRVFVYGTLQQGHSNHSLLENSTKLMRTETKGKFALGNVGYPYAFPSSIVPEKYSRLLYPVRGEVYKMDSTHTFNCLDGLEGYPTHYNRRIVEVSSGLKAWMYMQDDWKSASYCDACNLIDGAWQWAK